MVTEAMARLPAQWWTLHCFPDADGNAVWSCIIKEYTEDQHYHATGTTLDAAVNECVDAWEEDRQEVAIS